MFTDGITEAVDLHGQEFGEERLISHGSLAALPGFLAVKAGVVDIEAALEAGGKPIFRVEDDAADEGPSVVALGCF